MLKFNLLNNELLVDKEREHIRDYIEKNALIGVMENKHYVSVSRIFMQNALSDNLSDSKEILIDKLLSDNKFKEYILKTHK
jgi:hypothetical protein